MSRYTMRSYQLVQLAAGNEYYLWILMGDTYAQIIEKCFPDVTFKWQKVDKGAYQCHVKMDNETKNRLIQLLSLFKNHVLLVLNKHIKKHFSHELDECFALDFNFLYNGMTDETGYSHFGQLEHLAKELKDTKAMRQLAVSLSNLCMNHPNYLAADTICAIPRNPSETFHLPEILAEKVAKVTGKDNGIAYITKKKDLPKAQELRVEEKIKNLKDALNIDRSVKGKLIILIDDLYQSGATMWSVAKMLRQSGARKVYGLTCVKSWRDTDNQ